MSWGVVILRRVPAAPVSMRPSARVRVALVTAGPRKSGLEVAKDIRQAATVSVIKP